jgi:hypothetical protein
MNIIESYQHIWNDFCSDVATSKKKKSKELDFEKGPVKDFLTSLGWVKYGSHRLVEQHPIQFATAWHYADFALFLQENDNPEMIIELKRPARKKEEKDVAQLEDYMVKVECSFGMLVGEVLELYFIDFTKPKHFAELVSRIEFTENNEDAFQIITLILKQNYEAQKLREYCLQQLKLKEVVAYWNSSKGKDDLLSYILKSSSLPDSLKGRLQEMMSIIISIHTPVNESENSNNVDAPKVVSNNIQTKPSTDDHVVFKESCIRRVSEAIGQKLIKKSASEFVSDDGKNGYVFRTSKIYPQGGREKYWYAYRRPKNLSNCTNQYNVFGCNNADTIIIIPISEIEAQIEGMNSTQGENGTPSYWHIVFLKDRKGKMTWLISKPKIHEIDITDKLL